MSSSHEKAFTLIELLIVIAIILILIAIALPNFLEAQLRAKVARTQADLKGISVALESYHTDFKRYPWCHPIMRFCKGPSGPGDYLGWFWVALTTPQRYLGSRAPRDHFREVYSSGIKEGAGFGDLDYYQPFTRQLPSETGWRSGGHPADVAFVERVLIQRDGWAVYGVGPDLIHCDCCDSRGGGSTGCPVREFQAYSATNGTLSGGNIFYWGPGGSFDNPYTRDQ